MVGGVLGKHRINRIPPRRLLPRLKAAATVTEQLQLAVDPAALVLQAGDFSPNRVKVVQVDDRRGIALEPARLGPDRVQVVPIQPSHGKYLCNGLNCSAKFTPSQVKDQPCRSARAVGGYRRFGELWIERSMARSR